ncbi:hypothetical protein PZA11_006800 [Diplocarpon coronariae]
MSAYFPYSRYNAGVDVMTGLVQEVFKALYQKMSESFMQPSDLHFCQVACIDRTL